MMTLYECRECGAQRREQKIHAWCMACECGSRFWMEVPKLDPRDVVSLVAELEDLDDLDVH